jgi:hypothetical protein
VAAVEPIATALCEPRRVSSVPARREAALPKLYFLRELRRIHRHVDRQNRGAAVAELASANDAANCPKRRDADRAEEHLS